MFVLPLPQDIPPRVAAAVSGVSDAITSVVRGEYRNRFAYVRASAETNGYVVWHAHAAHCFGRALIVAWHSAETHPGYYHGRLRSLSCSCK